MEEAGAATVADGEDDQAGPSEQVRWVLTQAPSSPGLVPCACAIRAVATLLMGCLPSPLLLLPPMHRLVLGHDMVYDVTASQFSTNSA